MPETFLGYVIYIRASSLRFTVISSTVVHGFLWRSNERSFVEAVHEVSVSDVLDGNVIHADNMCYLTLPLDMPRTYAIF